MRTLIITLFLFANFLSADADFYNIKTDSTGTYQYNGLTEKGLDSLKKLRDDLRTRFQLFDNEFKSLKNTHHALTVSRLFAGNAFIYGPPGGAKSAIVEWMFKGEIEPAFQLQLHQMMTEQAFVGGQNFEKAKEGTFELNTKGSLADFRVALIDEVEKGNPAALSALLSLLNERKILAGSKVIDAKTETVFATSNSNLAELSEQFQANGQGSTAPALLNRFQFKCLVYNWLSASDQAELDDRRQIKRRLKALSKACPDSIATNEVFLAPPKIDFEQLRDFADILMDTDDNFAVFYRDLVSVMREQTNKAVRESEARQQKSRFAEPFVYFPSCDYTERLRQQIPEIVMYSAFIDFLLSDLADDKNLVSSTKKTIKLGPLSLWRAHLIMTTVGPGSVALTVGDDDKFNIEFKMSIDESKLRDNREVKLITNLKEEQERFRSEYLRTIQSYQDSIATAAKYTKADCEDGSDFEHQIQRR